MTVACGSEEEADAVAQAVVGARLAACAQVLGPVASTYWWQGRVERSTEWLCLLKSRTTLFDQVADAVRRAHSYETPEIVAVPLVAADPAYLQWLRSETGAAD